ncbi:hypothetical protein TNCV_467571 [Trichonephila clavipes]|nr:hypothetical protein TNCV_467571 [Trichonephila clavipes]
MFGYVLGYDTRMVDPRLLSPLEKFVFVPLPKVVDVVRGSPQKVLAVYQSIAFDVILTQDIEHVTAVRGLLVTYLVVLNHRKVRRTTPELGYLSPNFPATSMGGHLNLDRFNALHPFPHGTRLELRTRKPCPCILGHFVMLCNDVYGTIAFLGEHPTTEINAFQEWILLAQESLDNPVLSIERWFCEMSPILF